MKACFSPRTAFDTVDEITEANIIIAVVNGGEFSARRGLKTVSMAKKQPATGALKPRGHKIERITKLIEKRSKGVQMSQQNDHLNCFP